MKKIKNFLLMLDIGFDDGMLTEVMIEGLISEGYEAKGLRVPMYVWEEKEYLEKIRAELIQFSPDVIIYFFRGVVAPEAIDFLKQILEIYEGSKRPATLILNDRWEWHPPTEYKDIVDGHVSFPCGSEYILQGIEYVLNKGEDDKMLHL